MRLARTALVLAALHALGGGCARRSVPYRFRAPLVSSVRAEPPPVNPRFAAASYREDVETPEQAPTSRRWHLRASTAPTKAWSSPAAPGPERADDTLAGTLRALVGARRGQHSQVQFVMETLTAIGARPDSSLSAIPTPDELVATARSRNAADADSTPLLGDIAVFERVFRKEPASVLGVVVDTDARGTVEFVYLARGVVRRGFANPIYPDAKRDQRGRVLNTILRQQAGRGKKGAGDLAGELFSTYLRLERLRRRPGP